MQSVVLITMIRKNWRLITLENAIYMGMKKMILLLSLTQSYFYMNTSQLTILICHCVIYSIFRVNIRKLVDKKSLFILPVLQKIPAPQFYRILQWNRKEKKNKAEVIAMSIFEHDKEEGRTETAKSWVRGRCWIWHCGRQTTCTKRGYDCP